MSATFTGGGLKLKGGAAGGVKKTKKKEKKDVKEQDVAAAVAKQGAPAEATETVVNAGKTEAQRKHDEYLAKRQKDMLHKLAAKSHRDRVADYNQKLSQLSEHHDIPKVGPG